MAATVSITLVAFPVQVAPAAADRVILTDGRPAAAAWGYSVKVLAEQAA
jgi:hypothetical protein